MMKAGITGMGMVLSGLQDSTTAAGSKVLLLLLLPLTVLLSHMLIGCC